MHGFASEIVLSTIFFRKMHDMHYTQGYVGGFVLFCSVLFGTTKNSLFSGDSSGLSMKIMPIVLQGIPHLSYLMNLLNLIE